MYMYVRALRLVRLEVGQRDPHLVLYCTLFIHVAYAWDHQTLLDVASHDSFTIVIVTCFYHNTLLSIFITLIRKPLIHLRSCMM